jgi:hypothetical protein
MSYQDEAIKKTHNGKELVQLSVGKEIIELREDIENGVFHAGGNLELVYQAYCEIEKAHGHHPIKLDPSCSGCTIQMNNLIKNWFKLYDRGSVVVKASHGGVKSKPLVAIKDKKKAPKVAEDLSNKGDAKRFTGKTGGYTDQGTPDYDNMSYGELLKAFEKKASKKEQKDINGGNKPKKAQLLEYFKG